MKLILGLIIVSILIIGCSPQVLDTVEDVEATLNKETTKEARAFTYNNCKDLINKTIKFTGTVMYEECGKNCLGGCPNTGPLYCFYGIQNEDGCMVYAKSKSTELDHSKIKTQSNKFKIGQEVTLTNYVLVHNSYYCGEYGVNEPECTYFILGTNMEY